MAHRADRRGNGHVIVVQDDQHIAEVRPCIVHRLIGHPRGHGAVSDHADDLVVILHQIARLGETKASGDRGRGMRSAERIVLAFIALGETGKASTLAQCANAVLAARQNLVGIALVADIEDQLVVWRVEDRMDGDRQLDNAEPCPEMSARN